MNEIETYYPTSLKYETDLPNRLGWEISLGIKWVNKLFMPNAQMLADFLCHFLVAIFLFPCETFGADAYGQCLIEGVYLGVFRRN